MVKMIFGSEVWIS